MEKKEIDNAIKQFCAPFKNFNYNSKSFDNSYIVKFFNCGELQYDTETKIYSYRNKVETDDIIVFAKFLFLDKKKNALVLPVIDEKRKIRLKLYVGKFNAFKVVVGKKQGYAVRLNREYYKFYPLYISRDFESANGNAYAEKFDNLIFYNKGFDFILAKLKDSPVDNFIRVKK